MFEQSMLVEHPGRKGRSVLFSLTAQLLVIILAALVPLIFTEQLSPFKLARTYLAPPLPAAVPIVQPSSRPARNGPLLIKVRVFTAPRTIPDHVATTDAPAPPDFGVPNAVPDSGALTAMAGLVGDFIRATAQPIAPPKPTAKPTDVPRAKPLQVGGSVQSAKLTKKVVPAYPPLARQARISGTVRLIGVISKDGVIQNLQLVSGHPLLTQAALDAVRQWVYRPTLLNGQPVEVIAPIDVVFTLSQ